MHTLKVAEMHKDTVYQMKYLANNKIGPKINLRVSSQYSLLAQAHRKTNPFHLNKKVRKLTCFGLERTKIGSMCVKMWIKTSYSYLNPHLDYGTTLT